MTRTRRQGAGGRRGSPHGEAPGGYGAGAASRGRAPSSRTGARTGRRHAAALTALYTVSGATSLAYEVLWARILSLQFGVSIFGVVAVVAVFMAGLGGGSLLGVRLASRVRRPLAAFALLEALIAAFALVMPWGFAAADGALTALAPRTTLAQWYLLLGAASVLCLALPATAMGVGFPLVLRAAGALGASLGRIYGWNTLGGAAGAVVPLVLLPGLGWLTSTQVVAAAGLLTAAGAYALSLRGAGFTDPASPEVAPPPAAVDDPVPLRTLLAYAGVGAASLILQIGWTRLYGMVLMRTEYVLGVLLLVFLLGVGAGSLLARFLRSAWWFGALPAAACAGALLGLHLLPTISGWADGAQFGSLPRALFLQGAVIGATTLPITLALGSWLPLLAARSRDAIGAGARLYAANSLGAAAGVILAGTVLIPALGTAATTAAAAALLVAAGATCMRRALRWPAVAAAAAGAYLSAGLPPVAELLPRTLPDGRDLYVHEDALTITHVVALADGERMLLDDLQRIEASTEPLAVQGQMDQARLPLLLHPNPRSVLFLGLGTGISAAGSLPFPLEERVAVEISRGAIEAADAWLRPVNGGVTDHLTIHRDDAVRFLRADTATYDVIIGDLFHPDLAGRGALLSRQHFQRAKARLAPGGIFVQWIALHQFDPEALEVVFRTFAAVFPDGVAFSDGFRLALVGSDRIPGAPEALAHLSRLGPAGAEAATGGEGVWTWLGRYWGRVDPGPGAVQDAWAPRVEYHLTRTRQLREQHYVAVLRYLLERRPTVAEAGRELRVPEEDRGAFAAAYEATTLAHRSIVLGAHPATLGEAQRLTVEAYGLNPRDRWMGHEVAAMALAGAVAAPGEEGAAEDDFARLERVLAIRPDHVPTLKALWRLAERRGDTARAAGYVARIREISPLDAELAGAPGAGP